jgi:hypothetical protein
MCKGELNATSQNEMAGETDCRFRPNLDEMKGSIKLDTCRKSARDGDSVPALAICKEEFSEIYMKGYD